MINTTEVTFPDKVFDYLKQFLTRIAGIVDVFLIMVIMFVGMLLVIVFLMFCFVRTIMIVACVIIFNHPGILNVFRLLSLVLFHLHGNLQLNGAIRKVKKIG